MSLIKNSLAGLIGVTAMAAVASASSISATLYSASGTPNGVQPGTYGMMVQFNSTLFDQAFVGQLNWHNAGPTANLSDGLNAQLASILGSPNGTFSTYCIEGTQDVFFGQNETWQSGVVDLANAPQPGPPAGMGSTKAAELTELWNRSFDSIGSNNELGAAFQLAIWEIVYDGLPSTPGSVTSSNFTSGAFQAYGDNTAIGDAVNMLNSIGTGGTVPSEYTLYALSDPNIQDQVFAVPNGGTGTPPPSTPLPAALPAGLALMSGLGIARFVRRRA